ncbi:hypothetical protein WA556_004391, partial [Blastocystis sp. ATCC 50177/Nand II]
MPTVFAIDLGDASMRIARWKESKLKGVVSSSDVIVNDYQKTFSPVSLVLKRGCLLVSGHGVININSDRATVANHFKRLVGNNDLIKDLRQLIADKKVCENATLKGAEHAYITLAGTQFDVEALLSLILEYAFYIASDEVKLYDNITQIASTYASKVSGFLVSIPSYYSESHIKGIQMALDCKNLGEACFVRDNVAVAVDYGYNGNRVGNFDSQSRVVLFVDMGSVATTCTVVRYEKNSMEILESRYIMLGGQDFSSSLCKHIKKLYLEEKSLDGLSPKMLQKMEYQFLNAADKVKCTFASGSIMEASVEIEDLNSDDDFVDVELSKEDVEDVWSGRKGGENLLGQFDELVMHILQSPLLKREALTSCEIVGCAMRLSCVREHLERCLRAASSVSKVNSSLNMENTVACGAALIAQLYLQEGCLCLAEKEVPMAYELENGRVCHSLRVLGVGACDRNRDCFCVSNKSAILP